MEPYCFPLILKMFSCSCGENCPLEAKYCDKCGDHLRQNVTEWEASVDEGSKKHESRSSASATGSGGGASGLLTFAQFQARKEEDRSKHFRKKSGKKMKLDCKGNIDCQTKIKIGVMIMKHGRLSIKRGYTLPINVTPNITSEDPIGKAVEKHSGFHKAVIQSDKKAFHQVPYADKNKVGTLPGFNEPFTLKRYKEEIDKPYSRVMFYLCSSSDYFDSVLGDFDLDLDSGEPSEKATKFPPIPSNSNGNNNSVQNQAQINFVKSSATSPSPGQEQGENRMACSTLLTTEASDENKEKEQQRLISCPICISLHPVEQIKEHADNCSMWLLDDTNDQCDIPDASPTLL